MFPDDGHDRLRLRLNDDDGVLRFVSFEILNASRCRGIETALQEYFVGRALADVDFDYLQRLMGRGNGECTHAVIREVNKHLCLFVRSHEDQAATC
jgi:hypothetical protein